MSEIFDTDILVVGGGIFGCLAAIELSKVGMEVILVERHTCLMQGASLNNQNRLHLGYHYPRDLSTATQCQRGFKSFKDRFEDCILEGFDNVYFISSEGSNVDFHQYIEFCKKASLSVSQINLSNFELTVKNVSGGLYTDEVVYDSLILCKLVSRELRTQSIEVLKNTEVLSIEETHNGFISSTNNRVINSKSIVNCTYANFNNFNKGLGIKSKKLQFELTVVPIIEWRKEKNPVGITVMDGKFFTVLPFGKSGRYLLYHVEHTVQDTYVGYEYPAHWQEPKSIIGETLAKNVFKNMITSSAYWCPEILEANYVDYLATVRVVLADVESTDRRPSLIGKAPIVNPFYTVFSGKIDHSIWVAQDLVEKISKEIE